MQTFNRHRGILAASMVAVLILSLVTLWSGADFRFNKDNLKNSNQQKDFLAKQSELQAEYEKLLAETKTDPEASRRILAKVIDPQDIKKMIDDGLQVKQTVPLSKVDPAKVKYVSVDDKANMQKYFTSMVKDLQNFENTSGSGVLSALNGDIKQEDFVTLKSSLDNLVDKAYATPTLHAATAYHENLLSTYLAMDDIVSAYEPKSLDQETYSPWPVLYHGHVAINDYMEKASQSAKELQDKYQVKVALSEPQGGNNKPSLFASLFGVKTAEAFIPGIAPTPVINTIDFPRHIEMAIREALASSYAGFALQILRLYSKKIQDSLLITNVGYYRDAVVNARYVDDFSRKYLPGLDLSSPEAKLIKSFIPEIGCGKGVTDAQRVLIQQKVVEYLGFDPAKDLDLNSPDIYAQIDRAGHFASTSTGMTEIMKAIADTMGGKARDIANLDLSISHTKVPIVTEAGAVGGRIFKTANSLSTIQSFQQGAIGGAIQVGTPNANNAAGVVWIATIASMLKDIVVLGSALKEQETCIDTPQLEQIVAVPEPSKDRTDADSLLNCLQNYSDPSEDVKGAYKCVENALDDVANGVADPLIPPRGGVTTGDGTGLIMDKTCYVVGQVAKLAVRGAAPDELIYWTLYSQPSGKISYAGVNFEDSSGPHSTDAQGNWPSGSGTVPDQFAFTASDIGDWTRSVKVKDKEFRFNYKVAATEAECRTAPPTR